MKRFYIILTAFISLFAVTSQAADSASQILDKAVAKISGASSVECRFSVKSSNGDAAGSLSMAGRKFKLETPQATTWFDGTNMWTANPSTKEITLVNPSASEVRESNPLEYLNGYKSGYRVFFSKRKDSARYLILLNPKSKDSEIKAVEIALNKISLLPERLIIRDRNDKRTMVIVSAMNVKKDGKSGNYVCPVESMKDYEVIDLR